MAFVSLNSLSTEPNAIVVRGSYDADGRGVSNVSVEYRQQFNGTIELVFNDGQGGLRVQSSGHGLQNEDTIVIVGVSGTLEANGTWTVLRVNDDIFDLKESEYKQAYEGGGYWSQQPEQAHVHKVEGDPPPVNWEATVPAPSPGPYTVRARLQLDTGLTFNSLPMSVTVNRV